MNGMPDILTPSQVLLKTVPQIESKIGSAHQIQILQKFKNLLCQISDKRIVYGDRGVIRTAPYGHNFTNVATAVLNVNFEDSKNQ